MRLELAGYLDLCELRTLFIVYDTLTDHEYRAFFCLIGFSFTWILAQFGPRIRALSMARFAAESEAGDRLFLRRGSEEDTVAATISEQVGQMK